MAQKRNRIGFIARVDDTGLGVESLEFVEHMKPEKVMKVIAGDKPQHPERFPGITVKAEANGWVNRRDLEEFCKDIDVLFAIETPYHPHAFAIARKMGVKSVLRVNYEYLDPYPGECRPDLYLSPVDWNMKYVPQPNAVLPFPVCTEKIKYRERQKAKTFLHIAGHKGFMDRNGTNIVREAMKLLTTPAKVIIRDQASRNEKEYADLYDEGDVLLYPRRHSGQSLVVNEAQAAGLAIMMTDMGPQNVFLPKELLIEPNRILHIDIKRRIEFAEINPRKVAKKIDEFYNQDIWKFSRQSLTRAKAISWETLLPEYRRIFDQL